MKQTIISLLVLATAAFAGCTKTGPMKTEAESLLTVNVDDLLTRAVTAPTTSEGTVNDLQVFVYDAGGNMDIVHPFTSGELSEKKASFSVKTGVKTVVAVANLSGTSLTAAYNTYNLSGLKAVALDLAANVSSASCVPVMTGSQTVTLSAIGATASIPLSRLISRVTLASVKNSLPAPYGSVTLKRAFLCNVVGNQNIDGSASATTWYNPNATKTNAAASDVIKLANDADIKDLTYRDLGETVAVGAVCSYPAGATATKTFYGFPNPIKTSNNGWSSTFTPTATVLMIVAAIKGTDYYYPVALKSGLAANTEYAVNLVISGLGNTEDKPFDKIEKGSLSASVSLKDWTTGTTITENI